MTALYILKRYLLQLFFIRAVPAGYYSEAQESFEEVGCVIVYWVLPGTGWGNGDCYSGKPKSLYVRNDSFYELLIGVVTTLYLIKILIIASY